MTNNEAHSHKCRGCGTKWYHDPKDFEDSLLRMIFEHLCPKCGRKQAWVAEFYYEMRPAEKRRCTIYINHRRKGEERRGEGTL